jgi:serine/threonine-protein kinase
MIGTRLGNWVIDKELGRGGMGQVYLAHEDVPGGRQAAVKVLSPELAQESGFRQRFQREVDILRKLSHPHIVHFYEAGVQDGRHYYAMEYVPGRNFEQILRDTGRLPWKDVLDVALQVCPALKQAHDYGIIHRDIKPQNLLRAEDGSVKLTDFGIAKVFAGKQLTATGGLVGTAEYLSPEQAAGKQVTARSDLYSFGVVLYLLVTGRAPFTGRSVLELMHKHRYSQFDPPQRIVPQIPSELDEIICSLLEKDPAHRPANSHVLQRRLESLLRKAERQHSLTVDESDRTLAEGPAQVELPDEATEPAVPGPATLMSRLMRRELARGPRGPVAAFFNQPVVLGALLLVCLGIMVWGIWFRPKPEESAAAQTTAPSEAERFYHIGQRLSGDNPQGARQVWNNLIQAFQGVEGEQRWVRLAERDLKRLDNSESDERRWDSVRRIMQQARELRDQGKRDESEKKWSALEALYRDNPSAAWVLDEIKKDRGK